MSNIKTCILKIVLLGDCGVGKSAIISRYVNEAFPYIYKATLGTDVFTKEIIINGRLVILQIWDTAGQERFNCLNRAFFRGADCCVLVYDVTAPSSFNNLDAWRTEFLVQSNLVDEEDFPFIVIGNKIDLQPRIVASLTAEKWCQSKNMSYFETSAKEGFNLKPVFQTIAQRAMEQEAKANEFPKETIKLSEPKKRRFFTKC